MTARGGRVQTGPRQWFLVATYVVMLQWVPLSPLLPPIWFLGRRSNFNQLSFSPKKKTIFIFQNNAAPLLPVVYWFYTQLWVTQRYQATDLQSPLHDTPSKTEPKNVRVPSILHGSSVAKYEKLGSLFVKMPRIRGVPEPSQAPSTEPGGRKGG